MLFSPPPWVLIGATAISSVWKQRYRQSLSRRLLMEISWGVAVWAICPRVLFVVAWKPLSTVLSRWPRILEIGSSQDRQQWFVHGGPLGYGLGKLVEVLSACLLWNVVYPNTRLPIKIGDWPPTSVWMALGVFSSLVNVVLWAWSQAMKTRGDHSGVNDMVEDSLNRRLTFQEHCQLLGLAAVNAACEEITSRGFWLHEFESTGQLSPLHANLSQAVVFGIWHYHGIPSGLVGVGLTFVYGLLLGWMAQYGRGLLLPVATHTLADYFIFARIARQKESNKV